MLSDFDQAISATATVLNVLGIFVFALSGALAAARQKLDLFGMTVIAFLPALGGGTLRDMVMAQPASWLENPLVLIAPVIAAMFVFIFNSALIGKRLAVLIWADAVGMAAFAALGAQLGWEYAHNVFIAIVLGILPAVAGGALRDVVLNDVPLILHTDIYATAAALGAGATALCLFFGLANSAALVFGFLAAFCLRAAAIRFNLHLPRPGAQSK